MGRLKQPLVVVFSIGWIAPMWLASWLFVDFWQVEGWPRLAGRRPGNSFEWFGLIKGCLGLAFVWLAAAAAYWSWVGAGAIKHGRRSDSASTWTPPRGGA